VRDVQACRHPFDVAIRDICPLSINYEPYFLKSQLRGAEDCRNGHSALSALIGKVKGWLEANKVSAVPERIRHAFLHVRDCSSK
jgi:hypothetical protein